MPTIHAIKFVFKLAIHTIKSTMQLDTALLLKSKRLAGESFLIPVKEKS
jgi:hypothetical protein